MLQRDAEALLRIPEVQHVNEEPPFGVDPRLDEHAVVRFRRVRHEWIREAADAVHDLLPILRIVRDVLSPHLGVERRAGCLLGGRREAGIAILGEAVEKVLGIPQHILVVVARRARRQQATSALHEFDDLPGIRLADRMAVREDHHLRVRRFGVEVVDVLVAERDVRALKRVHHRVERLVADLGVAVVGEILPRGQDGDARQRLGSGVDPAVRVQEGNDLRVGVGQLRVVEVELLAGNRAAAPRVARNAAVDGAFEDADGDLLGRLRQRDLAVLHQPLRRNRDDVHRLHVLVVEHGRADVPVLHGVREIAFDVEAVAGIPVAQRIAAARDVVARIVDDHALVLAETLDEVVHLLAHPMETLGVELDPLLRHGIDGPFHVAELLVPGGDRENVWNLHVLEAREAEPGLVGNVLFQILPELPGAGFAKACPLLGHVEMDAVVSKLESPRYDLLHPFQVARPAHAELGLMGIIGHVRPAPIAVEVALEDFLGARQFLEEHFVVAGV